jgi:choline transport protein
MDTVQNDPSKPPHESIVSKEMESLKAHGVGADDEDILQMGYTAELPRKLNLFTLFSIGYEICLSPIALCLSLGVVLGSGGPALMVWGQWLIYFMALCVATSLAELASAYPNAGGQYYWAAVLAPQSSRRFLSFVVGYLSWASAVFGCASTLIAVAEMIIAMYALRNPGVEERPWEVFLVYQIVNILVMGLNFSSKIMPMTGRIYLYISMAAFAIIFVGILARAPVKQPAFFVFTSFVNLTGWNDGIAFCTGLLGVNWGFSALDAVTHMAEEIPDPRRNVPRALFATVGVGAVLAWPMALAILFCIKDIKSVVETDTGLVSLGFFLQVFEGNSAGAIGLQCLLLVSSLGAVFGIHTWQSRLAWSIARDKGFPFSSYIGKVAPAPFNVPVWAHIWSNLFVALLGCLYLGSSIAFNSFVSGGILMQYVAYSICIILMLLKGRSTIPHGPFWIGKLGLFCNIMTLVWTVFTLVFYCFPPATPVTPTTMNYVSVVVVGFVAVFSTYYFAYGRHSFQGPPMIY